MESDEPNQTENGDTLLKKVDDVLETIQPIYKSEKFDSLKQVILFNEYKRASQQSHLRMGRWSKCFVNNPIKLQHVKNYKRSSKLLIVCMKSLSMVSNFWFSKQNKYIHKLEYFISFSSRIPMQKLIHLTLNASKSV